MSLQPDDITQINGLIDDALDQRESDNAFGVSLIPYHTHNGTDSPKIDYNNLINLPATSGSGSANVVSMTAGATLTAAEAVYPQWYQNDGGITLDADLSVPNSAPIPTFGGSDSFSRSFTVGSGANETLVVYLGYIYNGTSYQITSITSVTYDGIAMTLVDSDNLSSGGTYYSWSYILVGAPSGTHNLVVTYTTTNSSGNPQNVNVYSNFYSYLNTKQTSQPEAHGKSGTGNTLSITTVANGALVTGSSTGTTLVSGLPNNQLGAGGGNELFTGDTGVLFPGGNAVTITGTGIGGTNSLLLGMSLAPFTAPAMGVLPTSASNSSTSATFIGYTNSSASEGSSVDVTINGVASGFTGLTFGAQYYLSNTTGAISTTPGSQSVKAGIANSATTIVR